MKTTLTVELNPTGRISKGNKELLEGTVETEHGTAYVKLYRAVQAAPAKPVAPAVRKANGVKLPSAVADAEASERMKAAAAALGLDVEKLIALKAVLGAK